MFEERHSQSTATGGAKASLSWFQQRGLATAQALGMTPDQLSLSPSCWSAPTLRRARPATCPRFMRHCRACDSQWASSVFVPWRSSLASWASAMVERAAPTSPNPSPSTHGVSSVDEAPLCSAVLPRSQRHGVLGPARWMRLPSSARPGWGWTGVSQSFISEPTCTRPRLALGMRSQPVSRICVATPPARNVCNTILLSWASSWGTRGSPRSSRTPASRPTP